MIQLILDVGGYAVAMPESKKGGYQVWEEALSEIITMISGRAVREYRGKVWRVSYQYGYFNGADRERLIAACEKGMREPLLCSFITQNSTDPQTSEFLITAYTRPKFMWSNSGEPLWGDFSIELREVRPHA